MFHTDAAVHHDALVESHQVGNPIVDEQIVADSNLGSTSVGAQERQVEQRGIEHDVAMVGYHRIGLRVGDIVDAAGTDTLGSISKNGRITFFWNSSLPLMASN